MRNEIIKYEQKLEFNLLNLIDEIKNNEYTVGEYKEFIIYEPKKRVIKKLPFKDRILHQWYIECFIKPYFVPRFINNSYACINGRGTHKCVMKTQEMMRSKRKESGSYYVVQSDISKFFNSINKDILFNILRKKMKDNKLLNLTKIIIYNNDDNCAGLPIGNYTSQYFANIYMNELDYYIKHKLNIKYYIRYLDDFVCLVDDKMEAKYVYNKVEEFVNNVLDIKLNPKSRYYKSVRGINFCGYIIFEEFILLRKRIKKNIIKTVRLYNNSKLSSEQYIRKMVSYMGHIKWANSYNFKVKYGIN